MVGSASETAEIPHTRGHVGLRSSLIFDLCDTFWRGKAGKHGSELQQLRKDDDRRVMPVPTPMSNLILPPVGGRDS